VEVGTTGVADQQGIAAQQQPRLLGPAAVGDQVGVVSGRVPRGGDRLDLGVAELDDLTVGKREMVELHAGPGRKIGARPGAFDQCRQAGDVVGLHVRVEYGDDRRALRFGEADVVVDQVDVGLDHGQLPVRLATQQVGGASRLVV